MCPYVLTDKRCGQETQVLNYLLSNISDIQADWSEYDNFLDNADDVFRQCSPLKIPNVAIDALTTVPARDELLWKQLWNSW